MYAVNAEVVLFADDAAFVLSAPSLPQLYDSIHSLFCDLSKYLLMNKLVPNLMKSKLMIFSSRNIGWLPDIRFDGEVIEWVKEYKYLGLLLTCTLSFGPHIDKICNRVSQFIGVFYHLSKSIPRRILLLLYNSFVLPHFVLHVEIWGSAPNYLLNRVVVKQNKLLRAILGVGLIDGLPTMHTAEMYTTLNILTVRNLYKLFLFKFLLKMQRGCLPYFFENILRPLLNSHTYNTRSGDFRHPMLHSENERRSIAHQVILLIESLHTDDYEPLSVASAVAKFKKNLIASQLQVTWGLFFFFLMSWSLVLSFTHCTLLNLIIMFSLLYVINILSAYFVLPYLFVYLSFLCYTCTIFNCILFHHICPVLSNFIYSATCHNVDYCFFFMLYLCVCIYLCRHVKLLCFTQLPAFLLAAS